MGARHPALAPGLPMKPPPDEKRNVARRGVVAKALRAGGNPGFPNRKGRLVYVADTIAQCADRAFVYSCDADGHDPTVVFRSCDHRLCPTCQPRLASRRKRTTKAALSRALSDHPHAQVAHFVFTIPNVEELEHDALRNMGKAVTKWFRRVAVRDNVLGLYRNLEVTWRKGSGWHPHIHCLLVLKPPRERQRNKHGLRNWGDLLRRLTMEWHALTGCSKTCGRKIASMAAKSGNDAHFSGMDADRRDLDLDDFDELVAQRKGCAGGGSCWMGSVMNLSRPTKAMTNVAQEVAKYIAKGIYHWDDERAEEREGAGIRVRTSRLAELAVALHRVRLAAGMGCLLGVIDPLEKVAMVCEACARLNRLNPGGELLDSTMRNRGSPEWLRIKAAEGCEESAVILASACEVYPHFWPDSQPSQSTPLRPESRRPQAQDCW
jgi:hypothetical protein